MRRLAKAPSAGPNRATSFGVALFVVALLTLGLSSTALAADQAYLNTGTFSSEGSGDGEMTHPRRSAVENSSGNVLIADRDNSRVQVFSPTSEAAEYLTQFGAGTLDKPFGLAVDQSTGDVYVSDPGKGEVFKFNSNGAPTPVYSLDAGFTSPAQGSGAGQLGSFEADLAVDPTSGDLLVLDVANDRVSRFEADGTFVSSFTGADSPDGAFTGLLDLDVAPNGDVYVVDSTGPVYVAGGEVGEQGECVNNAYCDSAPSRVIRFDSAGAYQSTVEPLQTGAAGLVTVDPGNNQILVGRVNPQGIKVRVYAPGGGRLIYVLNPPNVNTPFPSMAAAAGRLYMINDSDPVYLPGLARVAVQVFAALSLPEVSIDPPGASTGSTVQLSGMVDPEGTAAEWRFEYRLQGAGDFAEGPSGNLPAGSAPVAVSAELSGLQPSRAYEARLVARNGAGLDSASATVTFSTEESPPVAETRFAAPRTTVSARVNGLVDPLNDATTYYFEWGPTAAYGNAAPVGLPGSAGDGFGRVLLSQELTGLRPGSTYHYRIVASNSAGQDVGEDRTFTTRTEAEMEPPRRGIELVNPPDKGNQGIAGYLAAEGERVIWESLTGTPGSSQGNTSAFISERSPTGWVTKPLMPPSGDLVGSGEYPYVLRGATPDYSEMIWQVGDLPTWTHEYSQGDPISIVRAKAASANQEVLHNAPLGSWELATRQEVAYFVSSDARRVYTLMRANQNSPSQVYEIGSGTPRLVSVLPETGNPPACGATFSKGRKLASKDGSRIYFRSRGDDCGGPFHIYQFNSNGTATVSDDVVTRVDTDPVAGLPGDAGMQQTSADGKSLMYFSSARVTPDDENDAFDLYLWREGVGNDCVTCIVPDPRLVPRPEMNYLDNAVVSADLSHVYLSSPNQLTPDGPSGKPGLYVIENGEIRYIATANTATGAVLSFYSAATPDGETLMFTSESEGITTDRTDNVPQMFIYSDRTGSIECVSCSPAGVAPGNLMLPNFTAFYVLANEMPTGTDHRFISDDGGTLAFMTTAALVPEDANGGPDIYEWHNGTLSLLTDGEGEYGGKAASPLKLRGISADGVDVLFSVSARLTGFERDDVGQMYVARTDGGFSLSEPPRTCLEDACQGPLEEVPGFAWPGSIGLAGKGNAAESRVRKKARCRTVGTRRGKARPKVRCGKKKHQRKAGRGATRKGGGK